MLLSSTVSRPPARQKYFVPCAQCGDTLMAPDWSEHVSERCVRHIWACDACGYQFETTVYFRSDADAEMDAQAA